MPAPLVVNSEISIPAAELVFTFARSAGPGGQNVNKINTKAVLHWRVRETAHLPSAVRARFLTKYGNRVNLEGELVLACDEHREQGRNVTACREKLRAMISTVLTPPRRRIKTRPPRAAVERRIQTKQRLSEKKRSRRSNNDSAD